mmetsp:Transcript_47981/g.112320  ORF Transcript_47981/g.112320 Transcript_47981/m.112320 type:complete len:222 (-) Transcript_47981:316-981(-)
MVVFSEHATFHFQLDLRCATEPLEHVIDVLLLLLMASEVVADAHAFDLALDLALFEHLLCPLLQVHLVGALRRKALKKHAEVAHAGALFVETSRKDLLAVHEVQRVREQHHIQHSQHLGTCRGIGLQLLGDDCGCRVFAGHHGRDKNSRNHGLLRLRLLQGLEKLVRTARLGALQHVAKAYGIRNNPGGEEREHCDNEDKTNTVVEEAQSHPQDVLRGSRH